MENTIHAIPLQFDNLLMVDFSQAALDDGRIFDITARMAGLGVVHESYFLSDSYDRLKPILELDAEGIKIGCVYLSLGIFTMFLASVMRDNGVVNSSIYVQPTNWEKQHPQHIVMALTYNEENPPGREIVAIFGFLEDMIEIGIMSKEDYPSRRTLN